MLTVFGSLALDTIRTPRRTLKEALGGSGPYAAVSAANFSRTGLLGVAGTDLPRRHRDALAARVDVSGVETREGRTFRYEGRYDAALADRETLRTELNVIAGPRPRVPEEYRGSGFVYLANNDPEQNAAMLGEFDRVRFSMCDTIEFWISTKRRAVVRMIGMTDATVINDGEARLLTRETDLIRCARRIAGWGARYVVIKKGEHGSLLYHGGDVFPLPGFPSGRVTDPTGAGDAFAGAMMGRLAAGGRTGLGAVRGAAAYGNVMGSFAVEGYGLDGLLGAGRRDIAGRFRAYERMLRL